ncbi:MAG TPA: chalcone isomerase family protein [Gemmatimonadales bacterium]|nr:chalcone isomerase family protein [Gemmatimonadales bacterium]
MHATWSLMLALTLASPAGAAPAPAAAADTTRTLNGVTFPVEVTVGGRTLVLNGMALRKKAIVKVYVAGLYLPARESDADRILRADEPRRVVMQFLRGVDAKKMCDAWDDALRENTPEASEALKAQFRTLCGYMEDVEKGEQFVFTYVPGQGTTVEVRGKAKGTIEGKEFADALFKAWIGPKPGPGEGFKKRLLGLEG